MRSKLFLNNAPHISSKEAALLSGYTPDYIARLCRSGKLVGQVVGKTWYVDEAVLLDFLSSHKEEKQKRSESLSRERQIAYKKSVSYSNILNSLIGLWGDFVLGTKWQERALAFSFAILIVFGAYFGSLGFSVHPNRALLVSAAQSSVQDVAMSVALRVEGFSIFASKTFVSAALFSSRYFEGDKFAREAVSVVPIIDLFDNASQNISDAGNAVARITYGDLSSQVALASLAESTYEFLSKLFSGMYSSFAYIGESIGSISLSPTTSTKDKREHIPKLESSDQGLVVVPSSGDSLADARTKEKIRKTFSDEVAVLPDSEGDAGIIRPVFRDSEGDDYLYVLVPISEEEKP